MHSAVAILITTAMMRVSAQGIGEMCKKNPVVPCRKQVKDGPWYQLGDNRCMRAFLYKQHLNFDSAEISCNKYNVAGFKGHLVSINNRDELNNVTCAMYKVDRGTPRCWIGLKRAPSPKFLPEWVWTDGNRYDFSNWADGQPNNFLPRQFCVETNYQSRGLWNNEVCWVQKPYICQVRLY